MRRKRRLNPTRFGFDWTPPYVMQRLPRLAVISKLMKTQRAGKFKRTVEQLTASRSSLAGKRIGHRHHNQQVSSQVLLFWMVF